MLPRMLTVDAFCEILVVRLSNKIGPYGRLAAFLLSNRLLIMHKVRECSTLINLSSSKITVLQKSSTAHENLIRTGSHNSAAQEGAKHLRRADSIPGVNLFERIGAKASHFVKASQQPCRRSSLLS